MTESPAPPRSRLPHHKLIAYGVACELLLVIKAASIKDATLRDQALRAAKSACTNTAEGSGRVTRPDKRRALAIARGEAVEAVAALGIAELTGDAIPGSTAKAIPIAERLVALLTGFLLR